jgi:hypothetical protein
MTYRLTLSSENPTITNMTEQMQYVSGLVPVSEPLIMQEKLEFYNIVNLQLFFSDLEYTHLKVLMSAVS